MIERIGKVIDNMDELELGRVQIRILPEFSQLDEDLLPWVKPLSVKNSYITAENGVHDIPPVDSYVQVQISEDWQTFRYGGMLEIAEDFHPYPKFSEKFNVPDVGAQEYPQPSFKLSEDGLIVFHNKETSEVGIQHPSGTYVCIDTDGNLFTRGVKALTLSAANESVRVVLDGDSGEINVEAGKVNFITDQFQIGDGSDSAILYTPLEEVLKELLSHQHTAPSGPTLPAETSSKVPLNSKLGPKLSKMKSKKATLD